MASDKQVRYALALMRAAGISTTWMASEHKVLGATMRQRQGRVEDYVRSLDSASASELIDRLKTLAGG